MPFTHIRISFIFTFGLLLLWGCKKDEISGPPHVHVTGWSVADEETLAYLFQPLGTVFIYRDSVSGAYDTVTVTGRVTDTTEVWVEFLDYAPLYFQQDQWQSNYSSFDSGETSYQLRFGDPAVTTTFTYVKYKWGLGLGQDDFLKCPLQVGTVYSNSRRYTKIEHLHPSMLVYNQSYAYVLQILTLKESTEAYADVRYFYAKNIGLIKKINYKTNSNWNLIAVQQPAL